MLAETVGRGGGRGQGVTGWEEDESAFPTLRLPRGEREAHARMVMLRQR